MRSKNTQHTMRTWMSLEILKSVLVTRYLLLGQVLLFCFLKKKAKPAVSTSNTETQKIIYLLGVAFTGMSVKLRITVKKQ